MAVADAADAMCADRPYRSALAASQALDELTRCSGTQFDPLCVDAFVAVIRESPELLRSPGRAPSAVAA